MNKIKNLLHKSDSSSSRSSTSERSDRSPRTSTATDAPSSPTYSSRNTRPSTDTSRTSISNQNGGTSLEGNRKDNYATDGIATDGLTNGGATSQSSNRPIVDRNDTATQENTRGDGIASNVGSSNAVPARESRLEREEEAVDGGRTRTANTAGDFASPHTEGHVRDHKFNLGEAEHTHEHLAPVQHERIHRHETEEVAREREHEKHIHHVQHHVQPVFDKEVRDEVHHHNKVEPTRIHEHHANTKEDTAAFESLGARHKDSVEQGNQTREVVDLGERVHVTEQHHVHNVVQPVIEKETHDRHRVHTHIPIHHTTHNAPIVHDSVQHEALSKEDFLGRGGDLSSQISHDQAGAKALADHGCDRHVEGPGEDLIAKLGLK